MKCVVCKEDSAYLYDGTSYCELHLEMEIENDMGYKYSEWVKEYYTKEGRR